MMDIVIFNYILIFFIYLKKSCKYSIIIQVINLNTVYFDNSATTKIYKESLDRYIEISENLYENSAALHLGGINAEREIEKSRKIIAESFGAKPEEIIFTSGGTEGDNMAILGVAYANIRKGKHIITSSIEHHAVLHTCQHLENEGFEITYIKPEKDGKINPINIKNAIRDDTILISIMTANNETGVFQPINEIKAMCGSITLHTDAVQAYGKTDMRNINADIITVSAHKIHGPKGIGAIFVKKGTKIKPIIFGGNQDGVLHSGTMNTPAICAFATAVEISEKESGFNIEYMKSLRQYAIDKLNVIDNILINGEDSVNVVSVSFKDVRGEVLLHSLESKGIYVSTGSACNSKSTDISYVIDSMNVPREYAQGTIRMSFSKYNTKDEIDFACEKIYESVNRLRRFKRR